MARPVRLFPWRPSLAGWSFLLPACFILFVPFRLASGSISSSSSSSSSSSPASSSYPPPPLFLEEESEEANGEEEDRGGGTPCPQCHAVEDRQRATRLKVEAIKTQILSKLHLRGKPNITAPLPRELALEALRRGTEGQLPGHLFEAEPEIFSSEDEQTEDEEDENEVDSENTRANTNDDYYARTSEIIAFAEPGRSLNGHVLLDFYPLKEHSQHQHLRVTAATLWIQLRFSPSLPKRLRHLVRDHQLTLYVFRMSNSSGVEDVPEELLTSYKVAAASPGWRRLEVGQAVQQWFTGGAHHRNRLTLLVDCVGCDSFFEIMLFHEAATSNTINATSVARRIRHGNHHRDQPLGLRPFLAIATESVGKESRSRPKRHSLVCEGRVTQCCRQNLYVSFRELGWDDWIIAPKGYFANFCMGDCSMRRTPDTFITFHTHVIEEYRSRNPYASIHPCCAPTKLSPMSLIYFDPDLNIIKTDLPKMIVDECGCT